MAQNSWSSTLLLVQGKRWENRTTHRIPWHENPLIKREISTLFLGRSVIVHAIYIQVVPFIHLFNFGLWRILRLHCSTSENKGVLDPCQNQVSAVPSPKLLDKMHWNKLKYQNAFRRGVICNCNLCQQADLVASILRLTFAINYKSEMWTHCRTTCRLPYTISGLGCSGHRHFAWTVEHVF